MDSISPWFWTLTESFAVITALAYLLLALREKIACWYAATVSVLLYLLIFLRVQLIFESFLQLYYLAMAGYGFWYWRKHANRNHQITPISTLPVKWHLVAMLLIALGALTTGYIATIYTEAHLPYLDAWTTITSIFATWLMARKVLENWLYWILIDLVSIYLYWDRALYQTVFLFALYIIIAAFGWTVWRARYLSRDSKPAPIYAYQSE